MLWTLISSTPWHCSTARPSQSTGWVYRPGGWWSPGRWRSWISPRCTPPGRRENPSDRDLPMRRGIVIGLYLMEQTFHQNGRTAHVRWSGVDLNVTCWIHSNLTDPAPWLPRVLKNPLFGNTIVMLPSTKADFTKISEKKIRFLEFIIHLVIITSVFQFPFWNKEVLQRFVFFPIFSHLMTLDLIDSCNPVSCTPSGKPIHRKIRSLLRSFKHFCFDKLFTIWSHTDLRH